MVWTDEKVKALVQLWESGQSITQIGKALGMTRNAVVGKAHRIGLAKRASPIMRSEKPAQPRQPVQRHEATHHAAPAAPRTVQVREEQAAAPAGQQSQLTPAMLAALTPSSGPRCKWPIGDPKTTDFDFCSSVALPGKPYCAQHCAQAYTNWNPESAVEAVKAVNAA
ncbi:MAG TPA: GcrA family cell cycle regulator [Ferrovibrio sp.]|jgi:GcrA cell cycle regulator|uniref:GcrA family cell cycle regulator n=2 Tax=Ferrovibrio sp. TaxID=1917215 RepID=UPI002B4B100C|nr:GcrA family cell cycle regulator [Ferrovibrio sp.]HLT77918.1 GcrA family cell cycle regulator [Ferrovibrio sp.]